MKALFPISLGNAAFSTRSLETAIPHVPDTVGRITFLIADNLQLYNKGMAVTDGEGLAEVLKRYRYTNSEAGDRKRWLRKLHTKLSGGRGSIPWDITDMSDFADRQFVSIHRNVMLAYRTVPSFRRDIEAAALKYYEGKKTPPTETDLELSELYIVEEIALNLRIRVIGGHDCEYYLGSYHQPLIHVYRSKYGFDPADLTGYVGDVETFQFFTADTLSGSFEWREVGSA